MSSQSYTDSQEFSGPKSLLSIFLLEWKWHLFGAFLSFILASVLMSGWPNGLIPNISYPYTYGGDGYSHSWVIQRLIEGWVFDNPRSGYPFGSNFLDYPVPEVGQLVIMKMLSLLTKKYYSVYNLFFLLGFPVAFVSSFCVLRSIGINFFFSFTASLLYVFLPFHFQRIAHIYYTWYFVVPLFVYAAFRIFYNKCDTEERYSKPIRLLGYFVAFIILASFGVYYAIFGIIVLVTAGIAGWTKSGKFANFSKASIAASVVIFGVLINVLPTLVHEHMNGKNSAAICRNINDCEVYGLKMVQMIMPRSDHREKSLALKAQQYASHFPLVNENATATLGIVGVAGFLLLLLNFLVCLSGRKVDSRLNLFTILGIVLFLFGTIGGFGCVFSILVTKLIRGWNRISIFIGFCSIASFFLVCQIFIEEFLQSRAKYFLPIVSCTTLFIGMYDQTVPANMQYNEIVKSEFEKDRNFIKKIENSVPKGSVIYQLPYMKFPEVAPLNKLDTYGLAVGFLHSEHLHWTYAGMKWREGDLFYEALSQESIDKQLEVIKKLGFVGIYIDKRGYKDSAKELIEQLSLRIGKPILTCADGEKIFFRIPNVPKVELVGLTNLQIMQKVGYIVDKFGSRYDATIDEGIDFTKSRLPSFICDISGLSSPEPWGRWSDANVSQTVKITFCDPLPARFTLVLKAQPFVPNVNQELDVKIGSQRYQIKIPSGISESRLVVVLNKELINTIEFLPKFSSSPKELQLSDDTRKLGIGFIYLKIDRYVTIRK